MHKELEDETNNNKDNILLDENINNKTDDISQSYSDINDLPILQEDNIEDNIENNIEDNNNLFSENKAIFNKSNIKYDLDNTDTKKNIKKSIQENIREESIKQENIKQEIIPVPASQLQVQPKNDNKEEVKKELSTIIEFATTRAIETTYDLTNRFLDGEIERLDIYATNQDLVNLTQNKPNITHLDMSNCQLITDFTPLSKLTKLEELDISGCYNLLDMTYCSNLQKLRVLNLSNTGINDISLLPTINSLEVLNLKMTKIKNLIGIDKKFPKLHDLVLWGCGGIEDIEPISNLKELRVLDLEYCISLKHIKPVANLKKLIFLNLNFNKIEDLSPIQNLTKLQIFTMDFCSLALSEKNLTYFENLVNMKFLALRNRMIRNLHYFRNMTKLVDLELAGNAIQDLKPLENMTEMQKLNLSTNPSLKDLSPLHNMKKLKKLLINGAKSGKSITIPMNITDISIVKELPSLEVIESNFNQKIKDISPLQYCPKLEEAHFNDCFGIQDATPLRFCKGLAEVHFDNCTQIKDLSFMKYMKKLMFFTVAKTSCDRMLLSDLITNTGIKGVRDSGGSLPIHKAIIDVIKFRAGMLKITRKAIKEEDVL